MSDDPGRLEEALAEIKRLQEANRELEERARRSSLALEAATEGLWEWYPLENRQWTSPSYAKMLGYEEGEVPEQMEELAELLHPEDAERATANVRRFLESGDKEYRNETRIRKKDGSYLWIRSRGKIVERDGEGRATLVVGTNVDVTEEKRLELERERERERIEQAAGLVTALIWEADFERGAIFRGAN
ncbi:MAG: PAS domain-containing protein, partial [Ignavibacteriales bacterium]|nr:PAS domain-containing protein [Ignavibacteriales bacterium]